MLNKASQPCAYEIPDGKHTRSGRSIILGSNQPLNVLMPPPPVFYEPRGIFAAMTPNLNE
jgi:hypothetical protein